jgi:acetolactate synthase-1/2/3 large subunit
MAEGLYKTTGQVAVVLGNPGPGTANLFPGLVTARHEGVPVLAISSQHRAGSGYPATPATFQGQDQVDLIRPAVKWNAPVFEWTRIPELVRMAFREMFAGRPGPVHLDIPGPTLYAEADLRAPIFERSPARHSFRRNSGSAVAAAAKTPVISPARRRSRVDE